MGEFDRDQSHAQASGDGTRSLHPDEAMSLLTGSERRARRSFSPPQLKRGLALMLIGGGLFNVLAWVQQHERIWNQLHLRKAGDLVCIVLSVYALVIIKYAAREASWGVAVNRRSAAWWLPTIAMLGIVPAALVSTSTSVSLVVRWSVIVVVAGLWTALAEMRRRRDGRSVAWILTNSVVIWVFISVLVLRVDVSQLLIGACLLVWGSYQLAAVWRDENREITR